MVALGHDQCSLLGSYLGHPLHVHHRTHWKLAQATGVRQLVISAQEQTPGGRLTCSPARARAPSYCTEGGAHPADQVASAVRSLATASAADNGAMTLEMNEIPTGKPRRLDVLSYMPRPTSSKHPTYFYDGLEPLWVYHTQDQMTIKITVTEQFYSLSSPHKNSPASLSPFQGCEPATSLP